MNAYSPPTPIVQPLRVALTAALNTPIGKVVFVALPSAAALHVAQEAIPGVTDAAGHRRQRFHLGVIGEARNSRLVLLPSASVQA